MLFLLLVAACQHSAHDVQTSPPDLAESPVLVVPDLDVKLEHLEEQQQLTEDIIRELFPVEYGRVQAAICDTGEETNGCPEHRDPPRSD